MGVIVSRRRTLFSAASSVVIGSGITAGLAVSVADLVPVNPDADLIRLCREMVDLELAYRAIYDGPNAIPDDEGARGATSGMVDRIDAIVTEIEDLHATTAAGVLARAHTLAVQNGDFGSSFDWPETVIGRQLDYLLRDAAALAGRA